MHTHCLGSLFSLYVIKVQLGYMLISGYTITAAEDGILAFLLSTQNTQTMSFVGVLVRELGVHYGTCILPCIDV